MINNFLKLKEAKLSYIMHQYKFRKPPKQMTNDYMLNNILKLKEAKLTYIIHQYKIRKK